MFPSSRIQKKLNQELYIPWIICIFGGTTFSTFLKHYKYSRVRNSNTVSNLEWWYWTQLLVLLKFGVETPGCSLLSTAPVVGVFYITTLVAYKIGVSSLWELSLFKYIYSIALKKDTSTE